MATVTDAEIAKMAKLSGPVRAELLRKPGPGHARAQLVSGLATGNARGTSWGVVISHTGNANAALNRLFDEAKAAGNFAPVLKVGVDAELITQAQVDRVLAAGD